MGEEDMVDTLSAIKKKKEILPLATTWMNLKIVTLGEVSQTDKDKYYIVSVTCGILKETNELIYKTETDSQTQKTNLWLPKEKVGGINQKSGINIYTLLLLLLLSRFSRVRLCATP